MDAASLDFFKRLLETPSPSGFERPVQDVVRSYVADFADEVTTDLHGNVMACCNPRGKVRLMLAGHCDQIGLIVSHIDGDGYLYVQSIGGWDPQQLIGQRLTVWTADGPVPGIIARKAIHLLTDEERKQVPKLKDLWLDIGAKDKEEAAKTVRIGDPWARARSAAEPAVEPKSTAAARRFSFAVLDPSDCTQVTSTPWSSSSSQACSRITRLRGL